MKIFISWSGVTSRTVALALSTWMPKVIQGVKPFVSSKDLDKGSNWTVELAKELEDTDFGVICLAPDNLHSPWLHYEAGAITKSVDSRVAPVLFGVKKEDVGHPLAQLQLTEFDREDFELLMMSVNKVAGSQISDTQVKEAVEVWWPSLSSVLEEIEPPDQEMPAGATSAREPAKPEVDTSDMMTELLSLVRQMDRRLRAVELPTHMSDAARLNSERMRRVREQADGSLHELTRKLAEQGIYALEFKLDSNRIRITVPEPVELDDDHAIQQVISQEAMRSERDVWLIFNGKTIIADKNGEVTEMPF